MTEAKMTERKLSTGGAEICYWVRAGSGRGSKWLVFLHGAGVDHHMFDEQISAMPAEFSVLAWDARAHGKSTGQESFTFDAAVEDLLLVLEAVGIASAVFVGQSMGGNIAQELAMRHPKLVEKLVIIDSTRNAQTLSGLESFYAKITPAVLAMYPRGLLVSQSAKACGVRQSTQDYVKSCFEKMPKRTFIAVMRSLLACIAPNPAYREACPVLLVCGDKDNSGNIRSSMERWPGQTLHLVPDAGHNANQDQPELVNKLILEFPGA